MDFAPNAYIISYPRCWSIGASCSSTIAGRCRKSPTSNSVFPPKGLSASRLTRRVLSTTSSRSALTIEISSITMMSMCRRIVPRRCLGLMSSRFTIRGGMPKNLWMVWPPALRAAIPVGATTTCRSPSVLRPWMRDVLPVPARPCNSTIGEPLLSAVMRRSRPVSDDAVADGNRLAEELLQLQSYAWAGLGGGQSDQDQGSSSESRVPDGIVRILS